MASPRQINDIIFDILAGYYGASRTDNQVNDLFVRWLADMNLGWGDSLSAFYTAQTGIKDFGDAQWKYWSELGDSLALESGDIMLLESGDKFFTEDAYVFS